MITARAPFRLSFVGGGSDLPSFYSQSIGSVISTTIQQYIEVKIEYVDSKNITFCSEENITTSLWINLENKILKATLHRYSLKEGLIITVKSNVPPGSGLGSSSTFTVCLLQGIHALLNLKKSKKELAEEACLIEMSLLKEPIGKQDQYAAAIGGFNQFIFHSDETVEIIPLVIPKDKIGVLEESLLMFYTGVTRSASIELQKVNKNILSNSKKRETLDHMVELTFALRLELERGNVDSLGNFLHKNWLLKKSLSDSVSNIGFDDIYNKALLHGALGGKILGAGGGGYFLFYCPSNQQEELIKNLQLPCSKIQFDKIGATVI